MEYSEDFKKMVKAHQGRFIGYGNPNAKVLIIIPKMDIKSLAINNTNNSIQWLSNIDNKTDFNDVEDFFANGEFVGDESTFNPLYPLKGQRNVLQKSNDGTVICNDGTSLSWQRLPMILATASPEIVREIVLYIMKMDKDFWSMLYIVLHRCQPVKKDTYILIPKATYKELMNIFEKIDSRETRIMLIGKLIWLKYEQRSWGLDY